MGTSRILILSRVLYNLNQGGKGVKVIIFGPLRPALPTSPTRASTPREVRRFETSEPRSARSTRTAHTQNFLYIYWYSELGHHNYVSPPIILVIIL